MFASNHFRGLFWAGEMTISKGCQLLLSTTGQTVTSTRTGLYAMKSLNIADGGIVKSLPEVAAKLLEFDIGSIHIYGGGIMNSIWMHVTAGNITIDDLGHLRGDPVDDRYFNYFEAFFLRLMTFL